MCAFLTLFFSFFYNHSVSFKVINSLQFPSTLHHEFEVVVSVNGAADAFVVVTEFFECDDSISNLAVPLSHEFLEDFVGGLSSLFDIWVLAGIVDLSNIVELNLSILVEVQLIVGSPDPDLPCIVEVTLFKR